MNLDEFRELINQTEFDILEYKTLIPDVNRLAKLISSFANSKGGNLVIGVKEGENGNQVVGTNVEKACSILQQVQQKINPPLEFQSEVIDIDSKSVVVVTIHKSQIPRLVDGEVFQRKGAQLIQLSLIAPDVNLSAYNAVVSGSAAAALGNGSVTVGENGITIGGEIRNISISQPDLIPYETAYERVIGSAAFVLSQLEFSYGQTRSHAQGWYGASLIAAFLGLFLIVGGVVFVIFGKIGVGVFTTISGVIPEVVGLLFFSQSKKANERVDMIQKKLTATQEIITGVEIIDTIENQEERDKLKAMIIKKALDIK